jgi:hypothetical protein
MFRGARKPCKLFIKPREIQSIFLQQLKACVARINFEFLAVLGQQILRVCAHLVNYIFINRNVNKMSVLSINTFILVRSILNIGRCAVFDVNKPTMSSQIVQQWKPKYWIVDQQFQKLYFIVACTYFEIFRKSLYFGYIVDKFVDVSKYLNRFMAIVSFFYRIM